jgi:hypothetical protein
MRLKKSLTRAGDAMATRVPHRIGLYLAAVQFFFTLTWTVYVIYLPRLAALMGAGRRVGDRGGVAADAAAETAQVGRGCGVASVGESWICENRPAPFFTRGERHGDDRSCISGIGR